MPAGVPPAEIDVDETLVDGLLRVHCPDLAGRPLRRVPNGWDNHLFRLGDDLAVRLPRRRIAVDLMLKEQRWLPQVAPKLGLPVSAPLRALGPGPAFPWPWSVVPWIDGTTAEVTPPEAGEAARFGRFLRALHHAPPSDAPRNEVRGGLLARRSEAFHHRFDRVRGADIGASFSHARVLETWRQAMDAPVDLPDTWLHGDIHPMNVIVRAGRLAGIVDWGDCCAGDPATDLASAWFLFERAGNVFATYGSLTPATRRRARGWAVLFGVLFLDTGLHGDPRYGALGRRLLARVLADR